MLENLEIRSGYCLCELYICDAERVSSDGIVTTKSGLVLQEGLAKKHDVVEYTNHPFIGKVLRSGVEWISEGDILLLPLRLFQRVETLDHLIIGGIDYHLLKDDVCFCKVKGYDMSVYYKLMK